MHDCYWMWFSKKEDLFVVLQRWWWWKIGWKKKVVIWLSFIECMRGKQGTLELSIILTMEVSKMNSDELKMNTAYAWLSISNQIGTVWTTSFPIYIIKMLKHNKSCWEEWLKWEPYPLTLRWSTTSHHTLFFLSFRSIDSNLPAKKYLNIIFLVIWLWYMFLF